MCACDVHLTQVNKKYHHLTIKCHYLMVKYHHLTIKCHHLMVKYQHLMVEDVMYL